MALEPCRECGREISTQATACPQCGAPVRPLRSARSDPIDGRGEGLFLRGMNCGCAVLIGFMALIVVGWIVAYVAGSI